jgi:hypothetical protein
MKTANFWKTTALVLTGIVLGCGGGAGLRAATAQARPPRFEHMCMGPSMSIGGINNDVKEAGANGWELVTMWQGIVCFKRPAM